MTEISCELVEAKVTLAHFKDQKSGALGQELSLHGAVSWELQSWGLNSEI